MRGKVFCPPSMLLRRGADAVRGMTLSHTVAEPFTLPLFSSLFPFSVFFSSQCSLR